jgi:hypothetical protein
MIYTHRNGEAEPPSVPGEYWFDGAILGDNGPLSAFPPGTHIRDRVKVEQPRWAREPGLLVELPYGELPECFPPWQVVGRWWGPIVQPWEATTPDPVRGTLSARPFTAEEVRVVASFEFDGETWQPMPDPTPTPNAMIAALCQIGAVEFEQDGDQIACWVYAETLPYGWDVFVGATPEEALRSAWASLCQPTAPA